MSLIVSCAECGKKYKVGDDKAGKKIKCANCAAIIVIPAPESSDDGEFDLGDLPPAEDSNGLPPPALPRRSVSRKAESDPAPKRKRSSGGGGTSWVKILLILVGIMGGLSILTCCGWIGIARFINLSRPSSPADSSEIPWTMYTAQDSHFSVEFPDKNVEVLNQEAGRKEYRSKIPNVGNAFGVSHGVTAESYATAESQRQELKRVQDRTLVGRSDVTLLSSRESTVGGVPALRFEYKRVSAGHPLIFTTLVIQSNNRFYQLMVVSDEGANLSREIDRFFNSFRLLL